MENEIEKEKQTELEKFKEKKLENRRISRMYHILSEREPSKKQYYDKRSTEIKDCGSLVTEYIDMRTNPCTRIYKAYFCKNRFCPLCNYKIGKKTFKLVMDIVARPEVANCSYIFLTLTVKNCKASELSATIDLLLKSYTKLVGSKKNQFSKRFLGTFKVLESTYNSKTKEFHPHLHILAMVDKSYFRDVTKYLSKDNLIEIWQKALGVDYKPSVDVRATYDSNSDTVAEVSKYAVKSSEIVNADILQVYDDCFYGRRLKSYTGLFKDMRKLVLDDWKTTDKDYTDYELLVGNSFIIKNLYRWDDFKGEFKLKPIDKDVDSAKLEIENSIREVIQEIDFEEYL